MQSPTIPIPHTLADFVWLLLASFFVSGGSVAWYNAWKNRKKPAAEVHESEARTAKSFAEVRSLELQSNISAGDAVLRMVQQLTFSQIANEELHKENERLSNENDVYEKQIQWAKGIMKVKGIPWDC